MREDLSFLLSSLNDAQRQAVAAPLGRQVDDDRARPHALDGLLGDEER